MLQTSLKLLIFSSVLTTTSTCFSMDRQQSKSISFSISRESDKIINFQGQEKYLMHLIIACEYNHKHPFSVTPIIRKNGDRFHQHGEISDLNEQDFNDIHNKNYVYLDEHTQRQTRLSGDQIVPVSLLILGTTDRQSCLKLKFKRRCNQEATMPSNRHFFQMNTDHF